MQNEQQREFAIQRRLIPALVAGMPNRATFRGVRLLETHISWVLLAGRYAYKIKKAVNLGFLDFSTLQARHFYCKEEIRLNRRLAPKVYLDVIAIGGSPEKPVLGESPAIEYAVRMRRFLVSKQLDRLAARHRLLPQHIDSLAVTVAQFHLGLPAASIDSVFGTPEAVRQAAEQNFEQLQRLLTSEPDLDKLSALRCASDDEFACCRNLFEQRLLHGFVRECHGDLHLGNIVLMGKQPVPFDGIEFNPDLRWIDVMSEVAFTVMDLHYRELPHFAWRFLNRYVEITGDYQGVSLLHFYAAYRAMVRAKVSAIRADQVEPGCENKEDALNICREYMTLAELTLTSKEPALIITHGLPGSGKSTFAQLALERLQAIRLRSDVERKRLYGLTALADSRASGMDLYSGDISQRTYAKLHELASGLLKAGITVIVDAAFLKRQERVNFQQLANSLSVRFVIASVQASPDTLRERIRQRQRTADDASEADVAVLEKLTVTHDPLTAEEKLYAVEFLNEEAGVAACSEGWNSLQESLGRD